MSKYYTIYHILCNIKQLHSEIFLESTVKSTMCINPTMGLPTCNFIKWTYSIMITHSQTHLLTLPQHTVLACTAAA